MSAITKKLRQIGKKTAQSLEEKQKKEIKDFITDLEDAVQLMDDLIEDMTKEYEAQVIERRSLGEKVTATLPSFLQPQRIKRQEEKIQELKKARQKIKKVSEALNDFEQHLTVRPADETSLGQRVYEITYPGEQISQERLDELEIKLEQMEHNFVQQMEHISVQMNSLHNGLQQLAKQLEEHGMKLENIETKIDKMDSKLAQIQKKLKNIASKLTQNRALLLLLVGVVIGLLVVIIL